MVLNSGRYSHRMSGSYLGLNPLNTKRRPSPYRAVTTSHLGYKKPISWRYIGQKSLFVPR